MQKRSITVTEAARNFADCVNRAHYQNMTFVLLKNGVPVARLSPEPEKICRGAELAAALASTKLSNEEAAKWNRDLKAGRRALSKPEDKWQ